EETAENTSTGPLPLAVANVSSAPGSWTVTATSSNQSLVPDGNIVVGGSGLNRNLTITPAAGQTGTATVTVTVTDAYGGSGTRHSALAVLPPPPAQWTDQDVGSVGWAGGAGVQGDTYLVQGSGADIWNTADGFNFLFQPLTGNGEIVARV